MDTQVTADIEVDDECVYFRISIVIGSSVVTIELPETGDAAQWNCLSRAIRQQEHEYEPFSGENGKLNIIISSDEVKFQTETYGIGTSAVMSVTVPWDSCLDAFDVFYDYLVRVSGEDV